MARRTFLVAAGSVMLARSLPGAPSLKPIKIAQIGTAHGHAPEKMQTMRAFPADWEVVGYSEKDAALAARASTEIAFRGLPLLTEEQLLNTDQLRAVAVETRIEDACFTALRVIRAGKHVHLDKPGALGHAEFKAMRLEGEQRGLTVQMGYMLRYNPAFELLFRAIRAGWLGEIMEIDASMSKLSSSAERAAIGNLRGGSMFELGGHPIDAILTVLGPPTSVRTFSSPLGNDRVLDNQMAVLAYPRATATVRTNISDPFGSPRRHFNVTGTKGALEIVPLESGQVALSLTAPREGYARGTTRLQLDRKGGRYDGEFLDLARIVRGEKRLAWSAEHDIEVHRTVHQASGMGV